MMPSTSSNKVAVFWDLENCRPSYSISGNKVIDRIRSLVQDLGGITTFRAYIDVSLECTYSRSNSLHSDLQSSGLTLIHCPHNGKKDVADKMMIVDMLAFAIDNSAPATIVVITGDRDFAYAAAILRLRGYRIIVIAPPRTTHESLKLQADQLYDWQKDVLDGSDLDVNSSSLATFKSVGLVPSLPQSSGSLPAVVQGHLSSSPSSGSLGCEINPPPTNDPEAFPPSVSFNNSGTSGSSFRELEPCLSVPLGTGSYAPSRVEGTMDPSLTFNTRLSVGSKTEQCGATPNFSQSQVDMHTACSSVSSVSSPSIDPLGSLEALTEFETASLLSGPDDCRASNQASIIDRPDDSSSDKRAYASPSVGVELASDKSVENNAPSSAQNPNLVTKLLGTYDELEDGPSSVNKAERRHSCPAPLPSISDPTAQQPIITPEQPSGSKQTTLPSGSSLHTTTSTSSTIHPTLAARQRFQTLIAFFVQRRAAKRPTRILSAEVATEIKKLDPRVYEKAGVTKLKEFIEEARKAGVIISPGLDKEGNAWVEVHPALYSTPVDPPGTESNTSSPTSPKKTKTIDVVYEPLISRLHSENSSHRLLYSALGMFFRARHPDLYKKASVPGLSAYLQKAQQNGIVRIGRGDSPGSEWAELLPAHCKSEE